jgi:hypothetical protein
VDHLFGLTRNARPPAGIEADMEQARARAEAAGDEATPRFAVTSLTPCEVAARRLYEAVYCARSEMETLIKKCQLDLFAD